MPIFEAARAQLNDLRLKTWPQIFAEVAGYYASRPDKPFSHVVVDEAQDLGVPELRFLASIAPEGGDALFFAGDLGQRIFQQPFSWKVLGVDVRGRSQTLKINYRTSHQIRRAADRLLPKVVRDVDEIEQDRTDTIPVFNGPEPKVELYADAAAESAGVAAIVQGAVAGGILASGIGIFMRAREQLPRARAAVRESGQDAFDLSESSTDSGERVSVGTMHLAKGLEFRLVMVMACDDDLLPLSNRSSKSHAPTRCLIRRFRGCDSCGRRTAECPLLDCLLPLMAHCKSGCCAPTADSRAATLTPASNNRAPLFGESTRPQSRFRLRNTLDGEVAMGGLAGIWRFDSKATLSDELAPMLAAVRHRGPDDSGYWHNERVALGHNRLMIRDLTSAAHQPMVTADDNGVIVYDGEVYNSGELRKELENVGVAFESAGDTEVVLKSLHHWGPAEAIPRFNGMFALVYLDLREPALWLARDRIGIKQLLTADIGSDLIFASEGKALIAHPRMKRRVNRSALMQILTEERYAGQASILDGVEAVEPGSYWKVTDKRIERRRYYDVLEAIDVARIIDAQREHAANFVSRFEQRLRESINRYLVGDVPIATTCSGGIDSGLVSAFARDANPDIIAYVVDAPVGSGEGAFGERVGRHLGIEVRQVPVDRESFLRLWPRAVWHGATSDRPSNHPNAILSLALSEACRGDGFKGLLMGTGADGLLGEHRGLYVHYRSRRRLSWISRLVPVRAYRRSLDKLKRMPLREMAARGSPTLHLKLAMTHDGDYGLLGRRLFEKLAPIERDWDRAFLADCLLHFCIATPLVLHRHERMSAAASVEMRWPFLDNDFVDFGLHLPRRAKLHRRQGKWVAKQAALKLFPQGAAFARKTGFAVPPAYYAGSEQLLLNGMLAECFGWSSSTTRDIVSELASEDNFKFFVVGLELWLRLYFAGESAETLGEGLVALVSNTNWRA